MATPEGIAAEGRPDPAKPVLKGGGHQVVKRGDINAAYFDFGRLAPEKVEDRPGGVKVGQLPDGRMVIARPFSEPTLEIQSEQRPDFKIRYRL